MQYSRPFLERLSLSRPGSRLIDLVPCAIPAYVVKAELLILEHRPVGPVEEFALKAIDHGLVVPAEIGGILGLEDAFVLETLSSLQREDLIYQVVVGGMRELRLTRHGATVLETHLREAPARMEARIGFDRLVWDVSTEAQNHLIRRSEVEERGLTELRPKRQRRVEVKDLELAQVEREVNALRARGTKPTVLAVDRILRAETFFIESDIAIFDPEDGGQPQLAVLIDGRPSETHESALAALGGLAFLEAEIAEPGPEPQKVLTGDYGSEIARSLTEQAESADDRRERRAARVAAELDNEQPSDQVEPLGADPSNKPPTVEFIDTFEHRDYLQRALRETQRRLVIISPWIAASVVNTGFLESLGQLLRKGIRVHIGYGLEQRPGDRFVSEADQRAEKKLMALARRHEQNFTLVKLGNTHSKQLLFDDTHISGSFNWLSFAGSRNRTYRHEESTVVRRSDLVEAKYVDLCRRLDEAEHKL